jgi:hypothetical protein
MAVSRQDHKRSPAKFDTRAKLLTSAAAMLALLGGCTAIGKWERPANTSTASSGAGASLQMQDATATGSLALENLRIPPLPTLPAALARAGQPQHSRSRVTALPLPGLPALQALPSLQPLPDLPSPPPIGSANVSGGS